MTMIRRDHYATAEMHPASSAALSGSGISGRYVRLSTNEAEFVGCEWQRISQKILSTSPVV